jgi:hypothetical protein
MEKLFTLDEVKSLVEKILIEKNIENSTNILDEQTTFFNSELTLVTGLWDLGRGNLSEGWSRSFDFYLEKFEKLLLVNNNLIIFGDSELEEFIWKHRKKHNTMFVKRSLDWFRQNEYFDKIQSIRNDENWKSQSGWLRDSTQSKLEMYNPLVMSKMFLLNDARILDRFESKYLFWIDAGLCNTVHQGYFTHDKVLEKLPKYAEKFTFICFPYEAENEIHGFSYPKINQYATDDVKLVARAGFFGGPVDSISEINNKYYTMLIKTLSDGYMGTEESIFSILVYNSPEIINYYEIEGNGLLGKFFEDLKNDNLEVKNKKKYKQELNKIGLYVIGFNSPKQFETLILSMTEYDKNFLDKTEKFLLNNSTDESTYESYKELCDLHNFTMIKPDSNLGICGGRQFIAEHFNETNLDGYFFFEDDMFFYVGKDTTCRNGFLRKNENLFTNILQICEKENFDFIKLNFSEFFGDNSKQWSWYNVPQVFRESHWPDYCELPKIGIDENSPKTVFKHIKSHNGIPYADGEIFYCNWPQLITRIGNKKMFLDTTWANPFEQTWMSHMFQETIKGNLYPGILLMTPTEHNRFDHYDKSIRKES